MSATIGASPEPEQPLEAAIPLRPVLDSPETDATMTALAEPEVLIPELPVEPTESTEPLQPIDSSESRDHSESLDPSP